MFNPFLKINCRLEYMLEGGPVCTLQAVGIQFFASGLAWAWFFVGVNLYLVVIWQVHSSPPCQLTSLVD